MKTVFYLNLDDSIVGTLKYIPIEAFKVCENLTKYFFGGAEILSKEVHNTKTGEIRNMLEITMNSEKDYSLFLAILKICYDQKEILVQQQKESIEK